MGERGTNRMKREYTPPEIVVGTAGLSAHFVGFYISQRSCGTAAARGRNGESGRSVRGSSESPRTCSGGMYATVPTTDPVAVKRAAVSAVPSAPGSVSTRARPKSMTRATVVVQYGWTPPQVAANRRLPRIRRPVCAQPSRLQSPRWKGRPASLPRYLNRPTKPVDPPPSRIVPLSGCT
jgi:hypothetical protein